MKAITLHQPWASLLAHGIKQWETRSWPVPDKYLSPEDRGGALDKDAVEIAIHASANRSYMKELEPFADELSRYNLNKDGIPYGAILGMGYITTCYQIVKHVGYIDNIRRHVLDVRTKHDRAYLDIPAKTQRIYVKNRETQLGDWSNGRWIWGFECVYSAEHPVPCRGYQRFWTVPEDVWDKVEILPF